jgi:ABC-2 type transport system permease protein
MGKFWAVFKREYLERVRTKGFILVTVFGPLLMGAIMIVPNYMSYKTMRAAKVGRIEVIDATGAGYGNLVMQRLVGPMADTGMISVRVVAQAELAAAESLATKAVMEKSIAGFLVLDSATVAGTSARYAGKDASQMGEMEKLESAIRQTIVATRLEKEGLDPKKIDALTRVRLNLATERITDRGRDGGSGLASTILGFAIAILLYMSLIFYGQNTLRSVIEEKTTRVSEVIVASVSTDTLLAGKVFGVAAVSMTQITVWLVSGLALYQARQPIFAKLGMGALPAFALPTVSLGIWAAMLAFFVLGFLFYSSLFAAAGATVSSDQEAQQAAQPIMMMLIASIVFLQPIVLAPTSTLATVLTWLPFSAPIVMPLRMSVTPISSMEIIGVLILLAVSTVGSIWLSARIYRVGLLMYGKKPSFRELGRWIAQS